MVILTDMKNDSKTNTEIQDALFEHHEAPALVGAGEGEAQSLPRIIVRVTGCRVKTLDPDNFAGSCKDIIDGLRHAGLLFGDGWKEIKFEPDQREVAHYSEETTEVEIIYPET